MFLTRLIVSLAEFGLSIVLAVFVVFWSYKSFVKFTGAYDAEGEIARGNVADAVLMAALMAGASLILQQSIYPVVSIITLGMTSGGPAGYAPASLAAYAAGHLVFGFLLSIGCVQLSLRFFQLLNRDLDDEDQIRKGNVAVAVLMAAVILVISLFMQQGVGSLSKSLIPQPKLGVLGPSS